jgi:glycosyltransferase involved in cell wall biosynthesis
LAPASALRPIVAICTNYPADHATFTGGVETATAALLEGLADYQDEFDFHVVSLPHGIQADRVERRGGFCFHFLCVPSQPWLRPRFPLRVIRAHRELRRLGPHLVHCQDSTHLAVAAALGGHNRVFTVHGVRRHEAAKRSGWEFWSTHADAVFERGVHRSFDAFICISGYASRVVGQGPQTFAISNAVRSLFFEARREGPLPEKPRLLFVGVLAPLKRPLDLLLAHRDLYGRHLDLETIFCGAVEDAGYAAQMQRMARHWRIEGVHFMGCVSQNDLAELLGGTTALVLPSAQENAPMVIAEAMAAGVPVVATRIGGVPDLVDDGQTGLLYEAGNVRELTHCLEQLLASPSLQRQLGRRARQVAQATFSPDRVAEATVAVYRQLLNDRCRGGHVGTIA